MDISFVKSVMQRVATRGLDSISKRGAESTATNQVFDLADELADRGVHVEHAEHAITQFVGANEERILSEQISRVASIGEDLETRTQIVNVAKMFLTSEETIDTNKLAEVMNALNTNNEKQFLFKLLELGVNYIQQGRRIAEIEKDASGKKNIYSGDEILMGLIHETAPLKKEVEELARKVNLDNLS